jgi:hypothetical protein
MAGNLVIHKEFYLYVTYTSLKDTDDDTIAQISICLIRHNRIRVYT